MKEMHSLLGTTSSQAQGVCGSKSTIDRLSNLPDVIAHYILSLVDLRDLTRVGCVSKRCRQFFLSVPTLNLDGFPSMYRKSKSKRLRFLNQLDRYFVQRGNSKIQHLRIAWFFKGANSCDEHFRIMTWIYNAVRCNIEELELTFSMDDGTTFELPSCLLLCPTLRTLKVDLEGKTLKVPPFAIPSNLHHLNLRDVTISEEVWKWISCINIKELRLEYVYGIESICIESSSLEIFHLVFAYPDNKLTNLLLSGEKLEDISVTGIFDSRGTDLLKIVAPNLKRLRLMGYLMNQMDLGKFMCLEKAELFLNPTGDDYGKLLEVFCSIRNAKFLHLDEKTVQGLRDDLMPLPLHDVSCFQAYIAKLNDDLVPNLAHLLRGMPNLNTLFIGTSTPLVFEISPNCHVVYAGNSIGPLNRVKFDAPASGCNRSYWKSQNLACIDQLKEVRMDLSKGDNEVEFAQYILENAKNLRKMVILYSHHQSAAVRRARVNASKGMSSCTAQVIFHKKDLSDSWRY